VLYFALLLYYFTRCFYCCTQQPRPASLHLALGRPGVRYLLAKARTTGQILTLTRICLLGRRRWRASSLLALLETTVQILTRTRLPAGQEAVARVVMRFHFTTLLGTLLLYSTGGGGARRHALPLYYFTRYFYYCTQQEAVARVVMRALELAPHDADTVLNSAALMWEKEFKSKTGVHRDASVSSKASKLARSVSICTFWASHPERGTPGVHRVYLLYERPRRVGLLATSTKAQILTLTRLPVQRQTQACTAMPRSLGRVYLLY
jgi:hypothetical protein